MSNPKTCPECQNDFYGKRCSCGYQETASPGGHEYANRMRCAANGCPLPGGMLDGGQWVCRHHYGFPCTAWPRITDTLRKNARLVRMIQAALSEQLVDATGRRLKDYEALPLLADDLQREWPHLMPKGGDTVKTWAYLADAWLAREATPGFAKPEKFFAPRKPRPSHES